VRKPEGRVPSGAKAPVTPRAKVLGKKKIPRGWHPDWVAARKECGLGEENTSGGECVSLGFLRTGKKTHLRSWRRKKNS